MTFFNDNADKPYVDQDPITNRVVTDGDNPTNQQNPINEQKSQTGEGEPPSVCHALNTEGDVKPMEAKAGQTISVVASGTPANGAPTNGTPPTATPYILDSFQVNSKAALRCHSELSSESCTSAKNQDSSATPRNDSRSEPGYILEPQYPSCDIIAQTNHLAATEAIAANFQKSETDAPYQIFAAKIRGEGHILDNTPCEDAFDFATFPAPSGDTCLICALADGHGSEHYDLSRYGSAIAVKVALDELKTLYHNFGDSRSHLYTCLRDRLPTAITKKWKQEVIDDFSFRFPYDEIKSEYETTQRYGTTLLCAIACPQGIFFAQIGDGNIIISEQGVLQTPIKSNIGNIGKATDSLCQQNPVGRFHTAAYTPHVSVVSKETPQPDTVMLTPKPFDTVILSKAKDLAPHTKSQDSSAAPHNDNGSGPGHSPTTLFLSSDGLGDCYVDEAAFHKFVKAFTAQIAVTSFDEETKKLPDFMKTISAKGSFDDITIIVISLYRESSFNPPL